jgi:hypothetical protein
MMNGRIAYAHLFIYVRRDYKKQNKKHQGWAKLKISFRKFETGQIFETQNAKFEKHEIFETRNAKFETPKLF